MPHSTRETRIMQSLNIVFTGENQIELSSEDVPIVQAGQVLVEGKKSLISTGTECICLARNFAAGTHWDNWVKYPFYPGYSHTGEVIEVGKDVSNLKVGDHVAARIGHRQFFVANADNLLPLRSDVAHDHAAWFALASIVQNGIRRAQLELGDTVVIIGVGLLGQLAVQYARLSGAREVIAIDTPASATRLEMAKAHGATYTLAMGADEAKNAVHEITRGRLADVVFDVTGHPAVFPAALGLSRRFGKLLLLGDAGRPSLQCLTSDVMTRGVRIIGAHDIDAPPTESDYHYWTRNNMCQLFFDYVARGQMRIEDLISHRFSPEHARAAYDLLLNDRTSAMGVIFDWSQVN
jgi:2-desacetyl-2-hydroxyethyl bacteriochlorophyllide A dehydrogenase